MNHPVRLAILGSGNGTNAQQISEYFAGRTDVEVACIIYNKRDAYIAQRAKNLGIEARYFGRADFYDTNAVLDYLHEKQIDWVILAGFLWLVPEAMLEAYPNRIINIHPALLPKYGGRAASPSISSTTITTAEPPCSKHAAPSHRTIRPTRWRPRYTCSRKSTSPA